jgi:4-hydroxy-3-polyprenylbenzoate decarboxylase
MLALTEMGAIILPPVPGFYHHPRSVLDIVDHSVDRVLDLLGLPAEDAQRWDGARAISAVESKTTKPRARKPK